MERRDVQAAINAARADLPSNLPNNPTYYKYNPIDDLPILILALTSKTMTRQPRYTTSQSTSCSRPRFPRSAASAASSLAVATLPAVRVELNPASTLQIRYWT